MQIFYSKNRKLKFEILDESVYIKYNDDIYEICEGEDRLMITKNGKNLKPKKKLPQIKKRIIDPIPQDQHTFVKSEHADG